MMLNCTRPTKDSPGGWAIAQGRVFALLAAGGFVLAASIGGCERASNDAERAEVSEGAAEATADTGQGDGVGSASNPDEPWRVPAGWQRDPEPRSMRLATYVAPDPSGPVEVAITRFGGRVGGELPNVNRWRGQMGLAPIEASELEEALQRFEAPGFDGYETKIESPTGVMLAGAVYQADFDQTWFVRATAPDIETAERLAADVFGVTRSIAGLPVSGHGDAAAPK